MCIQEMRRYLKDLLEEKGGGFSTYTFLHLCTALTPSGRIGGAHWIGGLGEIDPASVYGPRSKPPAYFLDNF